mgnify:CR=1 FL=1
MLCHCVLLLVSTLPTDGNYIYFSSTIPDKGLYRLDYSKKEIIKLKEENAELNKKCSIGWTSVKHSGGAVPVYAIGVGAEAFTGRIDNTEFMGKILGEDK